jgi:uracil-DNA glycosylase family 4
MADRAAADGKVGKRPEVGTSTHDSEALLGRFWAGAIDCRECSTLAPWRKFVAAARGTPRYRIMILGEAPGRVSLENGRPFSNPRNLTVRNAIARALAPRRIEPEAILYFSDAVKCWPSSPRGANRSPSAAETRHCVQRHLVREIAIIRPRVVVAFGARATSALIGKTVRLADLHGKVLERPEGYRLIPLMHPSTINIAGMKRVGIKSVTDYEARLADLFRRELFNGDIVAEPEALSQPGAAT